MSTRCTRVARPARTSSSPVAKGSSVPAWPTFIPRPRPRRTPATMSWEVFPAGLSMRRIPPGIRSREAGCRGSWSGRGAGCPAEDSRAGPSAKLLGDLRPQEGHELVPGQRGGEARGLGVAAAPLLARDARDVHALVAGPQRDLLLALLPRGQAVAHERGHERALQ